MKAFILLLTALVIIAICVYPPHVSVRTTYLIHHIDGLQHLISADAQAAGHFWAWKPPRLEPAMEYNPKTGELFKYTHSAFVNKSLLAWYIAASLGYGLTLAYLAHRRRK